MENEVADLLAITGPAFSSTIVERLMRKGISQEAARKRVSRARGVVRRLEGLNFPNREQFLFLSKQSRTQDFRGKLIAALQNSGTSYGRALVALRSRRGAIPSLHFPGASGLPVEDTKGQLLCSQVLDQLQKLGLLTRTSTPEGDIIGLKDSPLLSNRRSAALIVEDVTLSVMKPWLVNLGWTSSGVLALRSANTAPKFGQYRFDLVGPTYLRALTDFRRGRLINGFIIADILLDREITLTDLGPFFSKLAVLVNQKRSTRLQPMFIADGFEYEALNQLRAKGCMVARPETIFGVDIASQLRELINTIEHAAVALTRDTEGVFRLLGKIAKLEGSSLNLRGVVLELIVAHLFQFDGYTIDIRRQIRSKGGDAAEIDVMASNRKEVICVECKGKSPGRLVGVDEIQTWIRTTIPRIRSWLNSRNDFPARRYFKFYASTGYEDEAIALIETIRESSRDQSIRFYEGKDVILQLRENKEASLIDIFREHFGQE